MRRSHAQIPAAQRALPSIAAMVDSFCGAHDVPVALANRMNLALDEVLSNIVKYAYTTPDSGSIDVELTFSDNRLTAIVEDTGRPFDPLQLPQRDARGPLKDRKAGGLGIMFMRRLMDGISYARNGNRNRLMLTIHVPSR